MTYITSTTKPTFCGYNSIAQDEPTSATNYDLDFNQSTNITVQSLVNIKIPNKSFIWGDCRSKNDSGDTDVRHHFNVRFQNANLTERSGAFEASGYAGIYNVNQSGGIAYATNRSGVEVSSTIRVTSIYNDFDQNANFNRFMGFRFA